MAREIWGCELIDNTTLKPKVIAVKLFKSFEKAKQQYYLSKHLRNPYRFWSFPRKFTPEEIEKLKKEGVEIEEVE